MTVGLALASLLALVLFARSQRGGVSGQLGTLLGLLQIPVAIAVLWLLALTIGWWTVAAFVAVSIVVGLLIPRESLGAWVNMQPLTGVAFVGLCAGAWALHYWR